MARVDFIGVIERAYDREGDDAAWLEQLTNAIAPAFSAGGPTTSFFFELEGDRANVGSFTSVGGKPLLRRDYERLHDEGAAMQTPPRSGYECEVFTVLSRVIGAETTARMMRGAGMESPDAIGLRANMTPAKGILVTTNVASGFRLRDKALWTRIAAHIGGALRLRRSQQAHGPDAAAAVLDSRGRFQHGSETAIAARTHLAASTANMDRARGKMRRLDPAAASELWRAMVNAQWSLVDWVDHDGKRFILAEENRVPFAPRKSLTPREEQAVACAAMGHSNKLIAYDLGISTGSVAQLLARAAQKLGVTNRVALIRAVRDRA